MLTHTINDPGELARQQLSDARRQLEVITHNARVVLGPRLRSLRHLLAGLNDPAAKAAGIVRETGERCKRHRAAAEAARCLAHEKRVAFDESRRVTGIPSRECMAELEAQARSLGAEDPDIAQRIKAFSFALAERDRAVAAAEDAEALCRRVESDALRTLEHARRECEEYRQRRAEIERQIANIGDPEAKVSAQRGLIRELEIKARH